MENHLQFLKKLNRRWPYEPAIPLLFVCLKRNENVSLQRLHTSVQQHYSAKPKPTQPKCPWTAKWMNKMRYVTFIPWNSAMRNTLLTHATKRVDFNNIMLSERNQTQNATYGMIPFTWSFSRRQNCRDRSHISGCLGLAVGQKVACWEVQGLRWSEAGSLKTSRWLRTQL